MTAGNPVRILLAFSLPLMAGNVFQQLYTVIDTMILGKFLGVQALAAVGSADYLNWFILGSVYSLAQGFSIKMAQDFGARDHASLRKCVGNSIILSIICAVVIALVSEVITDPVLKLLQTPDEIRPGGVLYLRILFGGIPLIMMYNLFACILRALGDARTPLYAMIITSFINIGLDLLFVMGFGWGIAGAASATIISWGCASIYCLYFIRKIDVLAMGKSDYQVDGQLTKKLMGLSVPLVFQNMVIAVGGMIVQFVVNGFGVTFIAGVVATNKLYGVLEIAASSYGFAMLTYMGQNLGARDLPRMKSGLKSGLVVALLTSLTITLAMVVFGKFILSGFISSDSPEVYAETMNVAYQYLCIMSGGLPVLYLLYVVRSSLQGMGNTFVALLSGIAEFVARCSCAVILPIFFSAVGMLFAEPAAWLAADFVLVPGYIIVMRKVRKQLSAPKEEEIPSQTENEVNV